MGEGREVGRESAEETVPAFSGGSSSWGGALRPGRGLHLGRSPRYPVPSRGLLPGQFQWLQVFVMGLRELKFRISGVTVPELCPVKAFPSLG